jgi:transcription initiation factor TFIIIB Brf1 subunit/transcription initiation factor TFIIB
MILGYTGSTIPAGKDYVSLAAAINYLSCKRYDEDITQRKISQAAGVTVVTLRHNFNTVLKSANINTKGMENLGIISIIVTSTKTIFFKTI